MEMVIDHKKGIYLPHLDNDRCTEIVGWVECNGTLPTPAGWFGTECASHACGCGDGGIARDAAHGSVATALWSRCNDEMRNI